MRLPAEWEPHERTIMGWPCRTELWGATMELARADYAAVANAVAAFEPVTMIANPGRDAELARAACTAAVEVVELPLDDSWLRDCGPIYRVEEDGGRTGVHFGFNAWGERFAPWDRDAAVGRLRVLGRIGAEKHSCPFAGMTRIRFKGFPRLRVETRRRFLSSLLGAPLGTHSM